MGRQERAKMAWSPDATMQVSEDGSAAVAATTVTVTIINQITTHADDDVDIVRYSFFNFCSRGTGYATLAARAAHRLKKRGTARSLDDSGACWLGGARLLRCVRVVATRSSCMAGPP